MGKTAQRGPKIKNEIDVCMWIRNEIQLEHTCVTR